MILQVQWLKNFKRFERITLVIITHNRYGFLLRLLRFYNLYDYNFNIIILDSSTVEQKYKDLDILLEKKNIRWEKIQLDVADKIAYGSNLIQTEYSVICADDDFIIPDAILKCISFLDNNLEYSSAHGIYYQHYKKV